MVDFILSGLNNSLTQTTTFAITDATAEIASTGPVLNLSMTADKWNKIFAMGDNIYRTYYSELPTLNHSLALTNTMATNTGLDNALWYKSDITYTAVTTSGSGAVVGSIIVTDNVVTSLFFSTAGSSYAAGDTITLTVPGFNGGNALIPYVVVASDLNGGAFISTTMTGTMTGLADNVPLVTSLYTSGISIAGGTGQGLTGTGAEIGSIVVTGNTISSIIFTTAGTGYVTNDTMAITVSGLNGGVALNDYTVVADDLSDGAFIATTMTGTLAGLSIPTEYTRNITIAGGTGQGLTGTGAVIGSILTNGGVVKNIKFGTSGSGYAVSDTLAITLITTVLTDYTVLAADLNSAGGFISGSTLETKDITDPGDGAASTAADGVKLQEPEETDQTIAADAIRSFIFGITNSRGQQGLYSNISTINAEIDTLLTTDGNTPAADATLLVNKLKYSIQQANGDTDSNNDVGNLSRQLKLLCLAGDATRLTDDTATDMYASTNVLSNIVGDLSSVSGEVTYVDGIYTHGTGSKSFSFVKSGNPAATAAVIDKITIRNGKVAGVTFSDAGAGYAAGETLTITTNILTTTANVAMTAYTLVAGDLDADGAFNNKLHNFLFEAGDSLSFQVAINPKNTPSNQENKNYNIKVTMT